MPNDNLLSKGTTTEVDGKPTTVLIIAPKAELTANDNVDNPAS